MFVVMAVVIARRREKGSFRGDRSPREEVKSGGFRDENGSLLWRWKLTTIIIIPRAVYMSWRPVMTIMEPHGRWIASTTEGWS